QGENLPQLLNRWRRDDAEKLRKIVEYLQELSLAAGLYPQHVKSNVLQIMVNIGRRAFSLEDVGFGLSQVLPMLVSDVQLGEAATLVMSQPELHLHPSAQAAIADYIWRRTKDLKRQYVVETHSEYLINRFRLLVSKGVVPEEEVALYYLTLEEDRVEPK